jgi:hypothetical protein
MTGKQVAALVAVLKAAYPRMVIDADTLRVYGLALQDLDHEQAQAAILSIIATEKFFPSIAEIRAAVAERVCGLPTAERAWGEVEEAIRGYDPSNSDTWWPEWTAPIVQTAILACGGLGRLERSSNPSADRAHFFRIYNDLRTVETRRCTVAGLLDKGNRPALMAGAR